MTTVYDLYKKHNKSIVSCRCTLAFVSFAALLIILPLSPKSAYPAQIRLAWNPVIDPDITGYMVYYGTSSGDYDVTLDVGNWTSVTIEDLEDGEAYYFSVTAYDLGDNESGYSNEVCINCASQGATNSSGGGGGGGCFIATVAYGFLMAQ